MPKASKGTTSWEHVYSAALHDKGKLVGKPYADCSNEINKVFDWFKSGNVDFKDANKIVAHVNANLAWKTPKAKANKLSALGTFMKICSDEIAGNCGMHTVKEEREKVRELIHKKAWERVSEYEEGRNDKKAAEDIAPQIWSKEEYDMFRNDKRRNCAHLRENFAELTDQQKNEYQKSLIADLYGSMPNIRTIHHTLLKRGWTDEDNFVLNFGNELEFIYMKHKISNIIGAVKHTLSKQDEPMLFKNIEYLINLPGNNSPYLFFNFVKGEKFNTRQFREFILKAHENEDRNSIGARVLRIMSLSRDWDDIPSINELYEMARKCGQKTPIQTGQYAVNL